MDYGEGVLGQVDWHCFFVDLLGGVEKADGWYMVVIFTVWVLYVGH